ncbi:hypothetical protein GQ457_09G021980 [Hibiscus cannabinus]
MCHSLHLSRDELEVVERVVEGVGRAPVHLDEIGTEPVNEETLPPPPIGGEEHSSSLATDLRGAFLKPCYDLERGIPQASLQAYALFPTMQIASMGKARRQGGSNLTFVQPLLGHESDPMLVIYRSWIFGFDSGIPRVIISGRFCYWTGSRGLHLLVSEPGCW